MMRVLHLISNLGAGGAEASLFQLLKNNKNDKQVVVSMSDAGFYGAQIEALGIPVHTLDMPPGRLTLGGLSKLYRLVKKERPDALQTWMYHADLIGGVIGKFAGVSSVFWGIHHSDLDPNVNSKILIWIARLCAVLSSFLPTAIVSCSERSAVVHQAIGYKKSKFTVIPNGYDVEKFYYKENSRQLFRERLGVKDEFLIGMVGRWHPLKDHENLVSAICELNKTGNHSIRCVLVGNGMNANNKDLVDLVQRYKSESSFILFDSTDHVAEVMCGIDLHVLSSRSEAFPNVVAEAMACETPCVVTDVGDAAQIVGDTGWVVLSRSTEELTAGIRKALHAKNNFAEWNERKKLCRSRIVDRYDIKNIVQKYRQVWRASTFIRE